MQHGVTRWIRRPVRRRLAQHADAARGSGAGPRRRRRGPWSRASRRPPSRRSPGPCPPGSSPRRPRCSAIARSTIAAQLVARRRARGRGPRRSRAGSPPSSTSTPSTSLRRGLADDLPRPRPSPPAARSAAGSSLVSAGSRVADARRQLVVTQLASGRGSRRRRRPAPPRRSRPARRGRPAAARSSGGRPSSRSRRSARAAGSSGSAARARSSIASVGAIGTRSGSGK